MSDEQNQSESFEDAQEQMNRMLQELVDTDTNPDEPKWWQVMARLRGIKPTPKDNSEN